MSKIVTVTFNPAIDKSTTVENLIPDKKLSCSSPIYEPGGGGINVARAIKRLGGNATAITICGGNNGTLLLKLLEKEDVETIFVCSANETRENFIVADQKTHQQYRFGMPGPEIYVAEWEACLKEISNMDDIGYLVASGSIAPGMPDEIFARIGRIANEKGAKFIADTSGEALKKTLQNGVYLLKPNLKELGTLAGTNISDINQAIQAAQQIILQGKCEVLVTSLGPQGAILITNATTLHLKPPKVEIKSTVGAGDSMVAGIVFGLSENKTILEAFKFGIACGTAATLNPGTELCHPEDVNRLYASLC